MLKPSRKSQPQQQEQDDGHGKILLLTIFLAAEQGNITKLTACTASGVDINASNRQGRTAITLASLNKHYACVSVLIAAGADINKQDQTCF